MCWITPKPVLTATNYSQDSSSLNLLIVSVATVEEATQQDLNYSNLTTNFTKGLHETVNCWEIFLVFLIFFNSFAIVGNLIIFITIFVSKVFRRPVNYLVANLSLAAIFCSLSLIFRGLENTYGIWNFNPILCFILGTCHRVPHNMEAFTIVFIILDRHSLLKYPLKRETKDIVLKKICMIWLVALTLDIPRGFYHIYDPAVTTVYKCRKVFLFGDKNIHFTYYFIHSIFAYVIPILVLLHEFCSIHSHLTYLAVYNKYSDKICKRVHVLRGAWILTGIYLGFNIPQFILSFFHEFLLQLWPTTSSFLALVSPTRFIFYIAATFNSCCYPIFFYLTSSELRTKLKTFKTSVMN